MNLIRTGASALGKLLMLGALAAAFLAGLVGVVWLSLRGSEIKVPELVGKNFVDSEKEMDDLGLKLKKRATRYSEEKPNTVLEQLPKPGETVKSGQTILVVISEANPEGNEAPMTLQKESANTKTDDDDQGTDITPDKPVKSNKNSNVKKPSQTTRDIISNKSNKNSNTASDDADKTKPPAGDKQNTGDKNITTTPNKNTSTATPKNETVKPAPAKTPAKPAGDGDTRTRKVPQNNR